MKFLYASSLIILLLPFLANAADIGGVPIMIPENSSAKIGVLVNNIASFMAALLVAIAVIFVVYAAYLYLTSAGDPEKVREASKIILYAIISTVVALGAAGIIALGKAVLGFSSVGGGGGSSAPASAPPAPAWNPETQPAWNCGSGSFFNPC